MDKNSVRNGYDELGVEGYYQKHNKDYVNPHESIIQSLLSIAVEKYNIGNRILDLCCGSGEVTMMLKDYDVTGVDPFTAQAYKARTGNDLLELSFKDIAEGKLTGTYDSIICSFALHLCPESMLPQLLWRLGERSRTLIVITPHKRPDCDQISGWYITDEEILDRVRMRLYLR